MVLDNKGVALIVVVFAMMLMAVLGWTLVNLQSTDFDSSLRNFDSERALGLAEAGAQWAVFQLKTDSGWRTDSAHGYGSGYAQHNFSPGEYRLNCLDGSGADIGKVIVTSTGYIPSVASPRVRREVKITVTLGTFSESMQIKNLLNWTGAAAYSVNVRGNITAPNYEADGNGTYNEVGIDYSSTVPLKPPSTSPSNTRTVGSGSFPSISMADYETRAGSNVWNRTTKITTPSNINVQAVNRIRITANGFFANPAPAGGWSNVIIRNRRDQTSGMGAKWANRNWGYISSRINNNVAEVTFLDGTVNMFGSDVWTTSNQVEMGRRFTGNINNNDIWYIKGDVVLDAITDDVNLDDTSVVSEGDIVIKGATSNTVESNIDAGDYPSLATNDGNIFSDDEPSGGSQASKRNKRQFAGLIYTQNGDVSFNYIRGTALMGENVTLKGSIDLRYDDDLLDLTGFVTSSSQIVWQEQ